MKLMPQIKTNLIILNFTPTRTFNSYNTKRAIHGRIHYTFTRSVVENAVSMTNMTSNGTQGPVPWIKMLNIVHLTLFCSLQENKSRSKKHDNHGT